MLGASGSGKTLFLHGMYAMLSAGVGGWFMYTWDPDDDTDIMDVWTLLNDKGEPPPPTDVDGQKRYEFVFNHGITPMIAIDCVDFRGGVADGRLGEAKDVAEMRERLQQTDSVYLVLDGGRLAEWLIKIKDLGEDERITRNPANDPMRIARLSRFVSDAAAARRSRGKLAPSVVVLITKSDLISGITGMPKGQALRLAAKRLHTIVPIAYAEGVTTLVCPVQVGRFGPDQHQRVKPEDLDPVGLHQPFIFSLWHYLTEAIEDDTETLRQLHEQNARAYQEINELRGRWLTRGRIGQLERGIEDAGRRISDLDNTINGAQSMVTQLMDQLSTLPIIRDGMLQI
jgi:hypothetical protein